MNCRVISDPHTHTCYSHGVGSVDDVVRSAVAKGLQEVHITEHGYAHYYARKMDHDRYNKMRSEIEQARLRYPQIKIVFGVEANICSTDGHIDINDDDLELFDVINVGFHTLCKMNNLKSYWKLHWLAFLAYKCHLHFLANASVRACTKAMIRTLERYQINMITHIMSNYPVDLRQVAQVCVDRGTIIEINNARGMPNARQLKTIRDIDVRFAIGSDAHKPEGIGGCKRAFEIVMESGISLDQVINLQK